MVESRFSLVVCSGGEDGGANALILDVMLAAVLCF